MRTLAAGVSAVNVAEAVLYGGIAFCVSLFIVGFIRDSVRVGVISGFCFGLAVALVDLLARYYEVGGAP